MKRLSRLSDRSDTKNKLRIRNKSIGSSLKIWISAESSIAWVE